MEVVDDIEYNEAEHNRLINAVSKLDKTQHIKEPTRNEPAIRNSEFNLIKSSNKLDLKKVAQVLENTASHIQIGKKLKKTHNSSKVLPKPLEKPQAERIKRATGYEEQKTKVGRWDPVVARSRTVDYVSFPLKYESSKLQPTKDFLSKLKLKSPLEIELDEIDPPAVVEEVEEEQAYPMSYEEMIEHRQNLAKLRAKESFKAAKAKRQSKIKSKKYHRILKKERLKQQLKEFEELQKTNPEEALKKLETLEKARALERHTLRHKNTGKWAKNLMIRAKYDKEVRQQLAEQLAVSRSLTQKTANDQSSDDEEGSDNIPDMTLAQDPMNPWILKRSDKSNVDAEFDFGYKKYVKERMFKQKIDSDTESESSEDNDVTDITESNEKSNLDNALNKIVKQKNIESNKNKQTKNISKELNTGTKPHSLNNGKSLEELILDKGLSGIVKKNAIKEQLKKADTHANKILKVKQKSKEIPKSEKLVSTTKWVVEDTNAKKQPQPNVTQVFENLESNIMDKVESKLKHFRKNIEQLEKRSQFSKRKHKNEPKEIDNLEYLQLKKQKIKPIIDEQLLESTSKTPDRIQKESIEPASLLNINENTSNAVTSEPNIDPSRFITAKPKYLSTAIPSGENNFDQLDDDEQVVPRVNIEEVFEEDDVVDSFKQEKEEEINKNKPEDIDLSLPGWGSWGGKGVKAPKKKRNRFILKAPDTKVRLDENKSDIIIREAKNPQLAAHKLTEVPFPFNSVKEYEASLRAPIGNTFIPEKAHKLLIRPSIITKAGTIIEPMDEQELLLPKNLRFKNEKVLNVIKKK